MYTALWYGIKGKNYVALQGVITEIEPSGIEVVPGKEQPKPQEAQRTIVPPPVVQPKGATLAAAIAGDRRRRRVFITMHYVSKTILDIWITNRHLFGYSSCLQIDFLVKRDNEEEGIKEG
jgi:hypothetical protein